MGTRSDGGHSARPFEIFSEKSKRCTARVRRGSRTLGFLDRLGAKKLRTRAVPFSCPLIRDFVVHFSTELWHDESSGLKTDLYC